MSISRAIAEQMEGSSWIRRMFEIGIRLRQEHGPENVFDYTLGNPDVEPPEAVIEALRRVVAEERPLSHGYMPNAGFPDVRAAIARGLAERIGAPFTGEDVIMTVGAAGAINTVLKSILDPGDEAIVLKPYFPEYRFYIQTHGGRVVEVETDERFQPDMARIAAAMGPRTKAILLNSPNNPTGAVYPADVLRELNAIVCEPAMVISDEPYRTLTYDGIKTPETLAFIERAVVAFSWSKAMAIAGERIGCLAISPRLAEAAPLRSACTFANRILGHVDRQQDSAQPRSAWRPPELNGLRRPAPAGLLLHVPETPIPDDVAFIGM